jgi:hypothetical protein
LGGNGDGATIALGHSIKSCKGLSCVSCESLLPTLRCCNTAV